MAESSRPDPLQRRSPAAWRLIEATPPGRLALPRCAACGHCFYPPQPFCPRCLHEPVLATVDDGFGRVLSVVAIHRSLAPTFQARAPVAVVLVQLEAGPTLFALADSTLQAGQAVRVSLRRDAAAARDPGVFIATHSSTQDPC